jgi:hypothetical protein
MFASRFAIPLFECLAGYLSLDEQLRELAPLRLTLEWHPLLSGSTVPYMYLRLL